MRATSARRRAGHTRGGRQYLGAPGKRATTRQGWGNKARVDADGKPLEDAGVCPACLTPIKVLVNGTIGAHAAGGYKVNITKGWVACLGVGQPPVQPEA